MRVRVKATKNEGRPGHWEETKTERKYDMKRVTQDMRVKAKSRKTQQQPLAPRGVTAQVISQNTEDHPPPIQGRHFSSSGITI